MGVSGFILPTNAREIVGANRNRSDIGYFSIVRQVTVELRSSNKHYS
jgi:hypothetical protein